MALRMVYKSPGITGTDIFKPFIKIIYACVSELLTRSVLKSLQYDPNKHNKISVCEKQSFLTLG